VEDEEGDRGVNDVGGGVIVGGIGGGVREDERHPANRRPAKAMDFSQDGVGFGRELGKEAVEGKAVPAVGTADSEDGGAGGDALEALGLGEDRKRRGRLTPAAQFTLAADAVPTGAVGTISDDHEGSTGEGAGYPEPCRDNRGVGGRNKGEGPEGGSGQLGGGGGGVSKAQRGGLQGSE
jgi:hypothetical protein